MATFGETLKRERELRKVTLREVSEATKIGLRYLEALEGNRFDQLPGGLFNKGFIRAYAKFIGLDGEALVNAYLFDLNSQQRPAPPRPRYAGFSIEEQGVQVPPPEARPTSGSRRWAVAGIVGAALLVCAAGVWLIALRGASSSPAASSSPPKELEKAQIAGEAARSSAAPSAEAQLPASSAGAEVPASSTGAELPATLPAAGESAPPAAPAEAQEPPPPEPLSLVLSASETTWIAILCDGTERLNKEIAGGDTVRLSCREEIRLSTGNAGTITIQINGNDCLPLGQRGEVVKDFALNRER